MLSRNASPHKRLLRLELHSFPFVFVVQRTSQSCIRNLTISEHQGARRRTRFSVFDKSSNRRSVWTGYCVCNQRKGKICRKVCSVKRLTKLHMKKGLRDQQDSHRIGSLFSSTSISWRTPPAGVTSHRNRQEPRVGLCKLARDTTVIRTSEVEERLRS